MKENSVSFSVEFSKVCNEPFDGSVVISSGDVILKMPLKRIYSNWGNDEFVYKINSVDASLSYGILIGLYTDYKKDLLKLGLFYSGVGFNWIDFQRSTKVAPLLESIRDNKLTDEQLDKVFNFNVIVIGQGLSEA